ncbi:MAG: hypothetical protein FJW36_05065 [Acidobacteria bacterium]|nr:hypothetical protein [Acidobacteriota bacterium]
MKPLEDGLEGMIETGRMPDEKSPVGAYLKSNPAAREEVALMMEISQLIRENFRLSAEERDELELAPGFYARVMARIESQTLPPSIWNFFLEPLGMRVVYASLALATLLFAATFMGPGSEAGADLVAMEQIEAVDSPVVEGAFLASDQSGMPVVESTNPDEDRGSVLAQLVTNEQ